MRRQTRNSSCTKYDPYLSLDKFDSNIKSLVKALKGNSNLIASCGKSESSILANLLRVLKKSPNSECNSYIGRFQDKYDDGTNIDLDDFMRDILMKYESLVEDGQWDTKSEKDVDILALTSQIQELKILFPKQSTYQDRNKNINVGNKILNNSGSACKTTAPTSGESWMKEKNGHTFHWCKWHEYWTATHNSKNAECNTIPQQIIPAAQNLQTKIIEDQFDIS